jgi:hypothetical protein
LEKGKGATLNYTAFTESQAEFLSQMAGANPKLWEYRYKIRLGRASVSGDLSDVLACLSHARESLERGLIQLPPIRNLSQYCSLEHACIMWYRVGADGNSILDFLQFHGSDPMAWLTAAYDNAYELLEIATALIAACKDPDFFSRVPFAFDTSVTLDPPTKTNDGRIPIIGKIINYFSEMNAEQVLHVFDQLHGTLTMRSKTKWRNSVILEAIRFGLNIAPRELANVYVIHDSGKPESWMTDAKRAQNRFGNHLNSARTKAHSDFDTLHSLHMQIRGQLSSL